MTYREIIYACLDSIKLASDDSYITEEHIKFFLSKIRAYLIKATYDKSLLPVSKSNYQTICLDLQKTEGLKECPCDLTGTIYLRSTQRIPATMPMGSITVYTDDYYQTGNISYVSMERMRYVGHNKWLGNMIYASIGPDNHLYLKSPNGSIDNLNRIRLVGLFEDPEKAIDLMCEEDCTCGEECDCGDNCSCGSKRKCDVLDEEYPLEDTLVNQAIDVLIKYLTNITYKPEDPANNASDDLSNLVRFLKQNMKSNFQKQLEE